MPTLHMSAVAPPISWEELETICLSAAKLRWKNAGFFKNGRRGQKQHGVDVWGHSRDGDLIGVQCKNTLGGISLETIKTEADNAEEFTPALDKLFIATTADRDQALQTQVRTLSAARKNDKKFTVDILYWDDIVSDLSTDEGVFYSHFPTSRPSTDPKTAHDRQLFNRYSALIESDGVIRFLREHNMAGFSFRTEELTPLFRFYEEWKGAEHEFITTGIEAIRKSLYAKVTEYCSAIGIETLPTDNIGWQWVPQDWEITEPERFSSCRHPAA